MRKLARSIGSGGQSSDACWTESAAWRQRRLLRWLM